MSFTYSYSFAISCLAFKVGVKKDENVNGFLNKNVAFVEGRSIGCSGIAPYRLYVILCGENITTVASITFKLCSNYIR